MMTELALLGEKS